MTGSPRDLRLDEELRRFLDWQSAELEGAPGTHDMIDRVASRTARRHRAQFDRRLILVLAMLAMLASLTATAVLLSRPPAIVIPPQGQQLVFVRLGAGDDPGTIFTRPAQSGVERSLEPGTMCCPTLSHDGRRLMVSVATPTGQTTTATLDTDLTHRQTLKLPDGTLNLGPGAWSPDDERIAFEGWDLANPDRNGIYLADASDGGGRRRLTSPPDGYRDLPLSFSPAGTAVLFLRESARDTWHLFTVRADGSGLRQLTTMRSAVGFGISPATWSPDGRQVAFAAFEPVGADVGRSAAFVIDATSGEPRRLSEWADYVTSAQFSPDGAWIVYDQPDLPQGHNLYLVRPDGTGRHRITSNADGGQCCARWTMDGRSLIFQKGPLGTELTNLWIVNVDGGGLHQLTDDPATYGWYALTPS